MSSPARARLGALQAEARADEGPQAEGAPDEGAKAEGPEPGPKAAEPDPLDEGPIDILADPRLTGVGTVDETCLPPSVLAYSRAEGARLGVDACHHAALLLSGLSAVVGDDWSVTLKVNDTSWRQQARIWAAMVAPSGTKKTDTMISALIGISELEVKPRKQFKIEEAKYLSEALQYEKNGKKGKAPEKPHEKRISTSDFTIEVLSELLQHDTKILLRADELSTVLGATETYGAAKINANRGHMLALYDGGERRIDRIQRGHIHVRNWSGVSLGHMQPDLVRPLVKFLSNDGLLQRYMIIMPPRPDHFDPELDDIASNPKAAELIIRLTEVIYNARAPKVELPGNKVRPAAVAACAKAQPYRRALFRLVERIEADHPATQTTLAPETVAMAYRFIMRIVVPSTIRFHEEIGSESGGSHARWIADYILAKKLQALTAAKVGRDYRQLRSQPLEIANALDMLERAGWLTKAGDWRNPFWTVDPRVHAKFKTRAEAERKRRAAVVATIKQSLVDLARPEDPPEMSRTASEPPFRGQAWHSRRHETGPRPRLAAKRTGGAVGWVFWCGVSAHARA